MNWAQLKTIFWLRWRLTRNQLFRGSSLGGVLAIIVLLCSLMLSPLAFAGAFALGYFVPRSSPEHTILILWDVATVMFLFAWAIGLMIELQRSETIDVHRLMHLPVALGQVFLINYVASHLTLTMFVGVPAMLGLAAGLVFARGPVFLLLLPLVLAMVFMVTAWTYCLRGWLATLMSNPRRRRTVIMGFTFGVMLLWFGPNLYFQVYASKAGQPPPNASKEDRAKSIDAKRARQLEMFTQLSNAQKFFPPFWLPLGARSLAAGNPWLALAATAGCLTLGALGLRRAYRGTVRFYQGDVGSGSVSKPNVAPARVGAPATTPVRSWLIELRLPGVPEPAAALAGATLRALLRAPEVKMSWGTSILVILFLGGMFFLRSAPELSESAKPFVGPGMAAIVLFTLVQFVGNQFGLDRDGFRALVLAPSDRRLLLLGKNLAVVPVALVFGLLIVLGASLWLAMPWMVVLASVFQFVVMLMLLMVLGNLMSILVPYRIEPGTMKPSKLPMLAMLGLMVAYMLFPLMMLPAFLPPLAAITWAALEWPSWVPVNLLLSLGLMIAVASGYWWSLTPLGELFARREHAILRRVTAGME